MLTRNLGWFRSSFHVVSCQDLANVTWSFAALHAKHRPLFDAVAAQSLDGVRPEVEWLTLG